MLNLEVLISNNVKLQKTLEKSKKKRYKLLRKNMNYVVKSKANRAEQINEPYPILDMKKRKNRFMILCNLMKLRTILSGVKIVEFNSYTKKSDKPVIFVPTHIGKFDIEVVYECIKEHALLLSGTEDRMHGTLNGYFLEKNGVNYVDRSDKVDRNNAIRKQKMDLENGINLLWFIEGTWNLSENQLVYDTSYAVIKLALECNVEIVPVGLNQIDKKIYVNFGESYKPDSSKELTESIQDLRDKLATLKWQLYEYNEINIQNGVSIEDYKNGMYENKYYCTKRCQLNNNYWAEFVRERIKEWPMTDLIEECEYVFQPKDEAYKYFDEFNSKITYLPNGEQLVKRI